MATITIVEYAAATRIEGGVAVQAAQEPPLASKTYAIGASSAQSDALNLGTKFIRVDTDAICRIESGSNPTALVANTGTKTGSKRMTAGAVEYFGVVGGHKLAFIADV